MGAAPRQPPLYTRSPAAAPSDQTTSCQRALRQHIRMLFGVVRGLAFTVMSRASSICRATPLKLTQHLLRLSQQQLHSLAW